MFDHISIGVRDVAAAKKFYDAALAPLGYSCLSAGATSLGYGKDGVALWVGAAEPAGCGPGRTRLRPTARRLPAPGHGGTTARGPLQAGLIR